MPSTPPHPYSTPSLTHTFLTTTANTFTSSATITRYSSPSPLLNKLTRSSALTKTIKAVDVTQSFIHLCSCNMGGSFVFLENNRVS
ncbi:hypothetical protein E2C01_088193 [Portunus trituberculatus]|uniref:Uncharacterized protein n=1 Tax=Portunus trituberculatus TaxID=210409 RepID=A0A5B7JIK7_PORTR|nr:hypothetical protein [Portunus trituberculatus]